MRQVFLDTETTGLSPESGDRIIEIGCVEIVNRRLTGRNLHFYVNPERRSHQDAIEVHGLSEEFLADKPLFAQIADELLEYLDGRRDHHPQRRVRRRLPRRRAAPARAGRRSPSHVVPRHRQPVDGARELPGQVELARRAVQALRGQQLGARAARRAARRGPAGRGLHPHDARPGLARHRRRRRARRRPGGAADRFQRPRADRRRRRRGGARRPRGGARRDRQGQRRPRGLAARAAGHAWSPWHNDALSKRPIRRRAGG